MPNGQFTRRGFLGGALAGGTALSLGTAQAQPRSKEDAKPSVQRHRVLGRTGFSASDISMGGRIEDANVVRYAYDHGVNFFDVAESYGNGEAERKLGEAMKHLDRKKVFIVTKLHLKPEDTQQTVLDRYAKCLERLQTPYADALYLHAVTKTSELDNPAFHGAVRILKTAGKLKHAGVSCHGPGDNEADDSMEKVLVTAAEDGRFDVMLLVYSFLNHEEGGKILEACQRNNVGTSLMKVMPGVIKVDPFDPKNPSADYKDLLARLAKYDIVGDAAVEYIEKRIARRSEKIEETKPFLAEHGIETDEELDRLSVQWVLKNAAAHTTCIALPGFEEVDKFLSLSGTEIATADEPRLRRWAGEHGTGYCRHGCTACASACPSRVPVSTIMRYAYYFAKQGREKYAMQKYSGLPISADNCLGCEAPCVEACPHGVNVVASLWQAQRLLTWA